MDRNRDQAQTATAAETQDLLTSHGVSSGADLTEAGLKLRAKPFVDVFKRQLPRQSEIEDIQRHFGVELAQEVFCSSVEQADTFGEFVRLLRTFKFENTPRTREAARASEVLVVPSVLPQAGRPWGSHLDDWRLWARQLGFTTDDVATKSRASISENAHIIGEHLKRKPHSQRILVTYSQGATEMRALIRRSREEGSPFSQLKYWINICGAANGSSSSEYLTATALRRIRSRFLLRSRYGNILEETSSDFGLFNEPIKLGSGPRVINIVGVPVRSQIPRGLHSLYYHLSKTQPNDGVVGLFESIVQPGFVVPIRGMSHRGEEQFLKPIFQRVLGVIAAEQASVVSTAAPLELEL
ncbi:MAG: hypothetical protein V4692_06830 [Bdellovibrionota bacterium]